MRLLFLSIPIDLRCLHFLSLGLACVTGSKHLCPCSTTSQGGHGYTSSDIKLTCERERERSLRAYKVRYALYVDIYIYTYVYICIYNHTPLPPAWWFPPPPLRPGGGFPATTIPTVLHWSACAAVSAWYPVYREYMEGICGSLQGDIWI